MSGFNKWRIKYNESYAKRFKFEPDYSQNELYFMELAYNASKERDAEIVESLRNDYASPSWNDALDEAAEAIRKELE